MQAAARAQQERVAGAALQIIPNRCAEPLAGSRNRHPLPKLARQRWVRGARGPPNAERSTGATSPFCSAHRLRERVTLASRACIVCVTNKRYDDHAGRGSENRQRENTSCRATPIGSYSSLSKLA